MSTASPDDALLRIHHRRRGGDEDCSVAAEDAIDTGTAMSEWTETTAATGAGEGGARREGAAVRRGSDEDAVETTTPPEDLGLAPRPHADLSVSAVPPGTGTALLLVACTAVWYWTSAMNAVASQTFASSVQRRGDGWVGVGPIGPSSSLMLMESVLVMTTVTGLQLLSGAVLGGAALVPLLLLFSDNGCDDKIGTSAGCSDVNGRRSVGFPASLGTRVFGWRKMARVGPGEVMLVSLHAFGSLATNLGFWYGSASLVQIIKLLEPFETLLIQAAADRFLISKVKGAGVIDPPTVLSMGLVVSGTFLLLSGRTSKPGHNMSIAFAVASGLCMSTRNVTKKLLRGGPSGGGGGGHGGDAISAGGGAKSKQQQLASLPPVSRPNKKNVDRIVECLTDFVRLSGLGALLCSACLLLIAAGSVLALPSSTTALASWPSPILSNVHSNLSVELVAYHALYNMASLTVLGFVAAPTHSLLNVGKRISNVAVATVLFGETLGPSSAYGLGIAAVGGVLYGNRHRWAERWRRWGELRQGRIYPPSSLWRWLLGNRGRRGRCGIGALLVVAFCVALFGAVVALHIARGITADAAGDGAASDVVPGGVFDPTPIIRPSMLRNATTTGSSVFDAAGVNRTEPRLRI